MQASGTARSELPHSGVPQISCKGRKIFTVNKNNVLRSTQLQRKKLPENGDRSWSVRNADGRESAKIHEKFYDGVLCFHRQAVENVYGDVSIFPPLVVETNFISKGVISDLRKSYSKTGG